MQAAILIDEAAWSRQHHRMAVCMAISSVAVFLVIATLEWPPKLDLPRLVPLELEVTLQPPPDATQAARRESTVPAAQPAPATAEAPPMPATATEPVTPAASADTPRPIEAPERPAAPAPPSAAVDASVEYWYAELVRVAEAVGARAAAEAQSMHPEFDELRRIAALRYAKPRTTKPQPIWEAEKDQYGRTLLKQGNRYMILEDPSLTNRYAFETFERHMIFFTIPFGRARAKNLPWVETIRARYDYLNREPDELPVLKAGFKPSRPD